MRPTSAYGPAVIPVRLYVVGYVEPQTGAAFLRQTEVKHYRMTSLPRQETNQFIASVPVEGFRYTLIRVRASAANFTDDLWLRPSLSPRLWIADYLAPRWSASKALVLAVVLAAVLSYLAGGLVGMLLYRQWHEYARMGLWNLLTVCALAMRVRDSTTAGSGFVALFSVMFVLLTIAVGFLARVALLW
jgi:hypothetical protein